MKMEFRPCEPDDVPSGDSSKPFPAMSREASGSRMHLASLASGGAIPIEAGIGLPAPTSLVPPISIDSPDDMVRTWKHSLRDVRNRFGVLINRIGLEHEKFTVLSNDCWGQELYAGYGLPYQTPLVGSGMYSNCFLRFLGDIEGYLESPLRFVARTRYPALQRIRNQRRAWPIAVLRDDVEVHFMHYQSEYASRRAWDAGLANLNLDRIAVKFTADKDGATEEQVEQFAGLPFARKLLISKRSRPEIACAIQTPDFIINGAVMFRRSLKYFDCTHWLNTGEVLTNTSRVRISRMIYHWGA